MTRMSMIVAAWVTCSLLAGGLQAQPDKPGPVVNPLKDTAVYPVAVWGMGYKTAPGFAELGVNVFVGDQGGAKRWCDEIAKHKCVGFVRWRGKSAAQRAAIAGSGGFLGWMHGDEPDNPKVVDGVYRPTGIPPAELIAEYGDMKKSATPAPMYLNLGQGLANGARQTTPDATYREFMKCADVVCYDVYPTSTQAHGTSRLHLVARGISRLKGFAGKDKPAWIWLECTSIGGEKSGIGQRPPLPHELRAEVWMSIVHGADAIGYFPHQFNPYRGGPAAIPEDLQKEMKLTNGLLHKLAPALRTGAKSMLKVDAGDGWVDAAMWKHDTGTLVVAVNMRNAPAKAAITLPEPVDQFTIVGQGRTAGAKRGKLTADLQPYEVRLFWTGKGLTNQSYRYPAPQKAKDALPDDICIDFEGKLPAGTKIEGNAKVSADKAHGGGKAIYVGEMGTVTIPLGQKDFRGRVTMWVYDSSKKHTKDDENKPSAGTCWGLQDSQKRMMLFGIIRRNFLSQASYSYAFTSRLRGYPSPGYAAIDRTKAGWYKWVFDLAQPGQLNVSVNGKATSSLAKQYGNFNNGFSAIRIVGGAKGEFEDICMDDILVEYPKPAPETPGKLAELPLQRDLRKGVMWSRTHHTRLCCPALAEAPALDGKLDDAAWAQAAPLVNWTNTRGTTTATYQTLCRIGRHGGKIYMAFECREDLLGELIATKKAGWQNDCIEIWFDPSNTRTSFCHITVTAAGKVEAGRTVPDEWGEGKKDEGWQPTIEAKAGRTEGGWTLELAIDKKDLEVPGAGEVWAFDVGRERRPLPTEVSAFTRGGFNDAFSFAELLFQPATVSLSNGVLTNRTDQPVTAKVEVLVSKKAPGTTFPNWETMWFDLARAAITVNLGPKGKANLLDRQMELKVPAGGRLRLTVLEPAAPKLLEEFIANVWGGIESK
ncbi:MAG TPA: sugar-binding protein [Phycisphaerae bacterium]|nr:sugar-binding protein [Phycisphaerae bacterium]HUT57130.1 sugar-binding protein [Phycisphaerae bacterium]